MAEKKNTYSSKISHGGNQKIQALFKDDSKSGKSVVKTGTDLRCGKK